MSSTAASQHGRGNFDFILDVTGPVAPPANLDTMILTPGTGGVEHTKTIPGTTPVIVSPRIDTLDDGCTPFAPGAFTGAIALVRRGTCSFVIKVNEATAAGAIAVVIANNQVTGITPSVPGVTIPVFSATQADSDLLRDFIVANPKTTAAIPFPAFVIPNKVDALAAFSSRGPAGFDLAKPDLTAPGAQVLAAVAGPTITGFEQNVDLLSGTSMASPHNAGSAVLLSQVHPEWTPSEMRSALVMTASRSILKEDQITPADAFAAGGGRVRVNRAAKAGLVMDETRANYLAANPATGGDPAKLNLPSMARSRCINRCEFVRTFRSTRRFSTFWIPRLRELAGAVQLVDDKGYSSQIFRVPGGGSVTLKIIIDSSKLPADGTWNFGSLDLLPLVGLDSPTLRLPIAVSVPPGKLQLDTDAVKLNVTAGESAQVVVTASNVGPGSDLTVSSSTAATSLRAVVNSPRDGTNFGFFSSFSTDTDIRQYASDDFTVATAANIGRIVTQGFTLAASLDSATALTWSIYPDAGGVPAGNPQTASSAAIWTYRTAPGSAGLSIVTNRLTRINTLSLSLADAGQNLSLTPGTYWLIVHTDTLFANRWVWYSVASQIGNRSVSFNAATGSWTPTAAPTLGLAFSVDENVSCAPWIKSIQPASVKFLPGMPQPLTVTIDATGLAPGNYVGYACLLSTDPTNPTPTVQVSLNVEAPAP